MQEGEASRGGGARDDSPRTKRLYGIRQSTTHTYRSSMNERSTGAECSEVMLPQYWSSRRVIF